MTKIVRVAAYTPEKVAHSSYPRYKVHRGAGRRMPESRMHATIRFILTTSPYIAWYTAPSAAAAAGTLSGPRSTAPAPRLPRTPTARPRPKRTMKPRRGPRASEIHSANEPISSTDSVTQFGGGGEGGGEDGGGGAGGGGVGGGGTGGGGAGGGGAGGGGVGGGGMGGGGVGGGGVGGGGVGGGGGGGDGLENIAWLAMGWTRQMTSTSDIQWRLWRGVA